MISQLEHLLLASPKTNLSLLILKRVCEPSCHSSQRFALLTRASLSPNPRGWHTGPFQTWTAYRNNIIGNSSAPPFLLPVNPSLPLCLTGPPFHSPNGKTSKKSVAFLPGSPFKILPVHLL